MILIFNQAARSTVQIISNINKKMYTVKWTGQLINICFLKILISQNFRRFEKTKFLSIFLYGNGHTIYGG